MKHVILLVIGALLTGIRNVDGQSQCPAKCLCFRTTVRCMFLQLDKVPQVPVETTILDLRFNKIKDIPPNSFRNLRYLNTLLLNNNQISRLRNGAFDGLQELKYLYLYKNRIKEIESNAFQGLEKLEQLYLHFNDLEEFSPDTHSLSSLQRLFLHNNKLKKIPTGIFKHMENLRRLRLDSNALVCDCHLMWLASMLREKLSFTQAAATCHSPPSLKGRQVVDLSENEFHCKHPKITEGPSDAEVTFGGTAYFTCRAEGDPTPDIIWLRNSNEVNTVNDPRYSVLHDGTLMIENARGDDVGYYECMAKSPAGEARSRLAKMNYHDDQVRPRFIRTSTSQETQVGGILQLECLATGYPPPDVTWHKNELPISPSDRVQTRSEGVLTITGVKEEDGGIYRCTASNNYGRITASAEVTVLRAPSFTELPRDQVVVQGSTVAMLCLADGNPPPTLSWFKDGFAISYNERISAESEGTVLRIQRTALHDSAKYTCRAENRLGVRETSATLQVNSPPRHHPPELTETPNDMEAIRGSTVEMVCRAEGDPRPSIRWHKDGETMVDGHKHRMSPDGSLYVFNVAKEDEGMYECMALNDYGYTRSASRLTVTDDFIRSNRVSDPIVVSAVEEARREVDRAVNDTVTYLYDRHRHHNLTPSDLFRISRFPTGPGREVARSGEIYERTLHIVHQKLQAGAKFNLSEFHYQDVLTPSQLALIANMSGCMVHRPDVNCSDMCFHSKYRSIDGTCNNLQNPMMGASLATFKRLLHPVYENGMNTPVGWSPNRLYNGYVKPSARLISSRLISTETVSPDDEVTHMLMQWGQFLDHDLDHAIPSISKESFIDHIDCKTSCDLAPPCFPISIPPDDPRIRSRRCMEFVRSSAICGSGTTSVFFEKVQPREQINQLTSYIDGSQVYGSSYEESRYLRLRGSPAGLLREGVLMPSGKSLMPPSENYPVDCRRDPRESDVGCFLAGDIRANEQIGLLAMHTIWFREHNRVAKELHRINPHWDGNTVYHEARKIVGAEMQHITYKHWMHHVIGPKGMKQLGEYKEYDPSVDARISNAFATAALRFGHTLINPVLERLDANFQTIPQGNLPLHKAFFAPWRLVDEGGVDPLMRGLIWTPAKLKKPDELLNSDLTERLFHLAHVVALDLAAMNIQRGRDHGLPSYNEYRQWCNLTRIESFHQLREHVSNRHVLRTLQEVYGHPDNIDLWVGGVLEDVEPGARVGPTFRCLLVDQFRRLRDGDRFWYESPSVFKPEQLIQIKQATLARVLCDNGDGIRHMTRDVFVLPDRQKPFSLFSCEEIPRVDLKLWTECCQDCSTSSPFTVRRVRRDLGYSYPEDRPVTMNHTTSSAVESDEEQYPKEVFTSLDERIEGLETALQTLDKVVRKLKKKIRRLEEEKTNCVDDSGRLRPEGSQWKKGNCTECNCQNSHISCTTTVCPVLSCDTPKFLREGDCCPTCLNS